MTSQKRPSSENTVVSGYQEVRTMGLRLTERKLILAGGDLLVLLSVFYLNLSVDSRFDLAEHAPKYLVWAITFVLIWGVIGSLFNVYDLARAASGFHSAWSAATAVVATIIIYYLIPRLTAGLPERRLQLFLFLGGSILGIVLWRLLYAGLFTQPVFQRRALVVGAGWSGRTLARAINEVDDESNNPYRGTGYRIIGFIDDDPDKQGADIDGILVLGSRHDLVALVERLRPDEVIIAITHSQIIYPELMQAILDVREMGIPVSPMTGLYERMTGRVPVEHAGMDLWVVFPVSDPPGGRLYLGLRRAFEIGFSLLGLAFMTAVIPFIWIGNRFTDPGDLFYRQVRVGQGGKPFKILKFRTMIMNAEQFSGAVWADEDDPRITPVGRFLRKTRLDELPQFWNALRGDMALIGPRPERPEFVAQLTQDIPFYRARHAIKPGITGWAQVKYRYGASVEDSLIKLQYDLYYIKHQGPYLDFLIFIKTIQVIFGFRGR